MDSEGNIWGADNSVTSANFHGDPGIWNSAQASGTFRVKTTTGGKRGGWQCRYYEGVLDDTSFDLGTYDYADAPSFLRAVGRFTAGSYVDNLHDDMDVQPHHANPYYIPNLTEKF